MSFGWRIVCSYHLHSPSVHSLILSIVCLIKGKRKLQVTELCFCLGHVTIFPLSIPLLSTFLVARCFFIPLPPFIRRNTLAPFLLSSQFHSTIVIVLLRLSNFDRLILLLFAFIFSGRVVLAFHHPKKPKYLSSPCRSHRFYISNTNRRFIQNGEKNAASTVGLNKIENFSPPSIDRKWNWISSLHTLFLLSSFFFLEHHEEIVWIEERREERV